jgi:hypothetical protein
MAAASMGQPLFLAYIEIPPAIEPKAGGQGFEVADSKRPLATIEPPF